MCFYNDLIRLTSHQGQCSAHIEQYGTIQWLQIDTPIFSSYTKKKNMDYLKIIISSRPTASLVTWPTISQDTSHYLTRTPCWRVVHPAASHFRVTQAFGVSTHLSWLVERRACVAVTFYLDFAYSGHSERSITDIPLFAKIKNVPHQTYLESSPCHRPCLILWQSFWD